MKTHTQLATEAIGFPPSSAPDLHTCPDCHQPGFTTKGLQAHRGNKTCKQRAAQLQPAAPKPQPEDPAAAHASRFAIFHGLACKSALELKLAKYYAGLEVNALCDLHEELYGETRGRPAGSEKTEGASVISMETFLEERLGVTARTARKYRAHFLDIAQNAPEIADKLNETWRQITAQLTETAGSPKRLQAGQELRLTALPQGCQPLPAEVLQAVCEHADEWGLYELFQAPARDVTPMPEEESSRKKLERAALVKFWSESLVRRLENQELHRLPAPILEAVITKMEEAAKRAREALAEKTSKKKGGRK